MAGFHVEEFDGENVSGSLELFAGEDERRVGYLFWSTTRRRRGRLRVRRNRHALDQAEDVDVGVTFMEFAGGRGAVEGDGLEIFFCRGLQAID